MVVMFLYTTDYNRLCFNKNTGIVVPVLNEFYDRRQRN
jgi:hypothetical protein